MKKTTNHKKNKGFSLIEMLVVVVIIASITGIVVIKGQDVREKNRVGELIHFDNSIQAELQEYLIAGYSFEEGESGIASGKTRTHDGFGNNGTINGSPSWTEGFMGNALDYSGTNSYVNLGPMEIGDEITVSAFIKSTNFNQTGFIIGENPVNQRWEIFFESNRLKWRGGSPVNNNIYCSVPTTNEWHHIIGTQRGTTGKLYIDGVLCGENTAPAMVNGSGDVEIGRFNSAYYYNGQIDELKIYSKAYGFEE